MSCLPRRSFRRSNIRFGRAQSGYALVRLLLAGGLLLIGTHARAQPLNFVVVVVDDQPFHTMDLGVMPALDTWAEQGVRFDRAYVSYPLCGPVRASFLAGGLEPRETGVTWNRSPQGGVEAFNDAETLGTHFQGAGYSTAHIGKYLNGYGALRPYVPPGWTLWVEKEYVGSSDQGPSVADPQPLRDPHWSYHYRDYALEFLDVHASEPFLLILSLPDPHWPAAPAPGDENLFEDFVYRPPSFLEPDLSDKPALIQAMAPNQCCPPGASSVEGADAFHRDQLRSLVGVDRVVESLHQKLEDLEVLDRTVLVYVGDNGLLWGEHQHWTKDYAYEESLRVPMIMIAPGNVPRRDSSLVVANLDIPATLYGLAGITAETDGEDLSELLENPTASMPTERVADFAYPPFVWAALITDRWKYVEWGDGDTELYDLELDPYELESRHADPSYFGLLALLAARRASHARTLAFREPWFRALPKARVGQPYSYALPVWGGTPPYHFRVESGELPPGITLDPDTGALEGVPQIEETYSDNAFYVEVRDSSVTRHNGGPQNAVKELSFWTLPEPGPLEGMLAGMVALFLLHSVRSKAMRQPGRRGEGAAQPGRRGSSSRDG